MERAIESTDVANSAGKDTRTRHSQFVSAIRSLIDIVENSLKEASSGNVENTITWVNLDKQERDELALFLSCPSKEKPKPSTNDARMDFVKDLPESSSSESRDGRNENKHRRFLSADANIGSWKINMPSEGEDTSEKSSDDRERPNLQLPKILSFSGLNGALEMKPRGKWYKSGGRKGKGGGHIVDLEASIPLKNNQANLVRYYLFYITGSFLFQKYPKSLKYQNLQFPPSLQYLKSKHSISNQNWSLQMHFSSIRMLEINDLYV